MQVLFRSYGTQINVPKNVFPKPFKDRLPKCTSFTWLRCSEVIDNNLCSALCKIAIFSYVCFVCGKCSCVCVIPGDWLCVCACMRQLCWSLPPISLTPAHPCTWVFFYVHCGFSTCPALRSQPQIRAVYLTAVASSLSYKNTPVPFLPPSSCISYFLSSLSINAAAPNVLHRAVSCRLVLLIFFLCWRKINSAHKQPCKLEETNTCRERAMHVRNALTQHCTAVRHGKIQSCKKKRAQHAIQQADDWQPSPPM